MKERWKNNWILPLFLFLLSAICLLTVVLGSNQSSLPKPLPQTFTGEYSRDGEVWYPLDDNADLNALDGDLFLRGHFSYDIFAIYHRERQLEEASHQVPQAPGADPRVPRHQLRV